MTRLLFFLALFTALIGVDPAAAQKNCVKGKPCGNSCISRDKTCRIGTTTKPKETTTPKAKTAPASRSDSDGVPSEMSYVASSRGRVYYWVGCSGWKSLSKSNLRWFKTSADAESAGYTPSTSPNCGPQNKAGVEIELPDKEVPVAFPAGTSYLGHKLTNWYYWIECSGWKIWDARDMVPFRSKEEAIGAGYTPSKKKECQGPDESADTKEEADLLTAPLDVPPGTNFVGRRDAMFYYHVDCSEVKTLHRSEIAYYFETSAEAEDAGFEANSQEGCLKGNMAEKTATGDCVIERVIDGDTVRCQGGITIRMLLIDAPEMSQGPFGQFSKNVLEELLPERKKVKLLYDVAMGDKYGRTLAHIKTMDGLLVNEAMLYMGAAVVSIYQPNVMMVDQYRRTQQSAQDREAGLWSKNGFECLPSEFRAGTCK